MYLEGHGCSDCGIVCCVVAIVKYSVFSLGVLKYVCVRGVMDVVFLLYYTYK